MAWTSRRVHSLWRAPLALLATILPPLGVIGLASPVIGAGYLFPGSGWAGLVAVALLPGIVLSTKVLDSGLRGAVLFVMICFLAGVASDEHFRNRGDAAPARGWVAVDTHFGDISEPYRGFAPPQFIQRKAVGSAAQVVIFPESVVPRWSEATESFWSKTLDQCRRRGQTPALGAGLPAQTATPKDKSQKLNDLKAYDFGAAVETSRNMDMQQHLPAARSRSFSSWTKPQGEPIDNTMLIVGAESATFYQRVPVPLGMWRPSSRISVPLRLNAPGVVALGHQRAAVLICVSFR